MANSVSCEKSIMEFCILEAIKVFETNTNCRVVGIEVERKVLGVIEGEEFVSISVHCELEENDNSD